VGVGVTGETPNPLDVLRSHRPEVGDYEAEFDAALAQVETLAEAARLIEDDGFWIENRWKLRAALVPFAAHENTHD